jgi:hypothetical protein
MNQSHFHSYPKLARFNYQIKRECDWRQRRLGARTRASAPSAAAAAAAPDRIQRGHGYPHIPTKSQLQEFNSTGAILASKLLVYPRQRAKSYPAEPKTLEIMRSLVIALGAVIFAAGAFLWCGNVFGFFVTFPFAGYLTLLVGGFTFRAGKKMNPQ